MEFWIRLEVPEKIEKGWHILGKFGLRYKKINRKWHLYYNDKKICECRYFKLRRKVKDVVLRKLVEHEKEAGKHINAH